MISNYTNFLFNIWFLGIEGKGQVSVGWIWLVVLVLYIYIRGCFIRLMMWKAHTQQFFQLDQLFWFFLWLMEKFKSWLDTNIFLGTYKHTYKTHGMNYFAINYMSILYTCIVFIIWLLVSFPAPVFSATIDTQPSAVTETGLLLPGK